MHDVQAFFVISAMQAFFLNFLIFLCTRVNSPLITSITGTIKVSDFGTCVGMHESRTAGIECLFCECHMSRNDASRRRARVSVPVSVSESVSVCRCVCVLGEYLSFVIVLCVSMS